MSTPQNETLKRTLGMREAVTITVGTVVGVGLFTTGAQIVGSMGSAVILATFMAMVISVYPSHLYAEMSAALPFAGGTYKYAQLGLGKAAGMLAGWNFIASLVAVTSGEALAFSFYFKTLFRAFGVELPISDVLLAAIPIVLFIVTNIHGTEMTGRLQNGFMFFFWGVAIIWALMMIPNIRLPSYMVLPESMNGLSGWSFIGMVAMIWWCFAGFETCCALGEEIKHPRINLPRALKLSPFIVFAVNAIFAAMDSVKRTKTTVPPHLQDAHYGGHEKLGHGIGYKYAHDYPNHYVHQQYLPTEIQGEHFYELSEMGYEKTLKEYQNKIKSQS